jgi:hypothetical protein
VSLRKSTIIAFCKKFKIQKGGVQSDSGWGIWFLTKMGLLL